MCCISDIVCCGIFCSLRSMVRHLGSSLSVMSWLHFCGIGLYAIINAYSWNCVGYVVRSVLWLFRWGRCGSWLFDGGWVRWGINISSRCL